MSAIYVGGMDTCVSDVLECINMKQFKCKVVSCVNPHSIVVAEQNPIFFKALVSSNWLLPDGIGILIAAKILGFNLKNRITGPDFFELLLIELEKVNGSVFFFGADDVTLLAIKKRLKIDFPGIKVTGAISPPFAPSFNRKDNKKWIDEINDAKPDVLLVGMTAPKQECWLHENRSKLEVNCACSIGAAFNFFADKSMRAPKYLSKLGLEWLHRLIKSPKKMWHRTFISAPRFLFMIVRQGFLCVK